MRKFFCTIVSGADWVLKTVWITEGLYLGTGFAFLNKKLPV